MIYDVFISGEKKMEMLGVLEKKIENILGLVKELREVNTRLESDNSALRYKVSQLESSLLNESEKLHEEYASARKTVDDLIADIDSLIEAGSR